MLVFRLLPFAAALLSLGLAAANVLRKKPTPATWCFFAGMAVLGLDSLFTGLSLLARDMADALRWLTLGLVTKSLVPAAWLGFSLTYSRGNARATLARWGIPLALVAAAPLALSLGFRDSLLEVVTVADTPAVMLRFGLVARLLNILLLLAFIIVLMNVEQTFRAAVGTMRWRIKMVVVGLAVIFGAHLYVRSQAVLFSAYDVALTTIESTGLLVGCLLLALAYARTGFAEADVYPSRTVLRSSLTVIIAGSYLFIVGVLAQLARRFGGAESFQMQALIVLLGMAGLAVLLLSDRFRQKVYAFVGKHFRQAQHDSVRIWAGLSRRLATVTGETALSTLSARFISETFDTLSVAVWLIDDSTGRLTRSTSTAPPPGASGGVEAVRTAADAVAAGLAARGEPFDLDAVREPWADQFRRLNPKTFTERSLGRLCVPLSAGERLLGAIVLADRVNGLAYSAEDLELLRCIGDQVSSALLNLRLADEVGHAREMEAFRTMSAFFVHDLKNAAASLNLTLKNLPVHFDNPAFREDALRSVGNTARRIDGMIERLSALRQRPELKQVVTDVNGLVTETIDRLNQLQGVKLSTHLGQVPPVAADREQLGAVVANLLLNARDAVANGGTITVSTLAQAGRVVLSVADNGRGMSEEFVRDALFRPFQSTKKDGLGIGMFQARLIVEAHRGTIHVDSEAGRGTTFRVSLPAGIEP